MLKTLVKKQLMEIFRSYFYNAKTNQKRSKNAVVGYIVLFAFVMIVIIGGMFTVMSLALCVPLAQVGMSWLYFAIMSLMATFLGAFGSVFNTYAGLYAAKDNDLLLSLPIPVRTLMASRLLGVYLMGLMYAAVVIVPAVIVYWMRVSAAPMAILGGADGAHFGLCPYALLRARLARRKGQPQAQAQEFHHGHHLARGHRGVLFLRL